jgi:hypothetical protein
LSAAIVATNGESNRGIHDLDSLDLPPTAEEPITARKDEFLRVSDTLLRISKEIWIVDPYLDPTQRRVGTVLEVLFKRIGQVAAASSPRRVTCIARAMTVLDDRGNSADDIIASMKQLTAAFGSGDVEFHYVLVNDRQSRDTLHDRFLFSVMGGIKSSHGFQELSGGRKVNISPVSEGEHKNLTRLFKEQQHDFNVMFDHRIRVNARG